MRTPFVVYRILNRWPSWAKWRYVTTAPHGECYQLDNKYRLTFNDEKLAQRVAIGMSQANEGEYRVVEEPAD